MSLLGERLTGDGEAAVFAAEAEDSEGSRGRLVKKQPWSVRPGERVLSRSKPHPLRALTLLLISVIILATPNIGHPPTDFLNASGALLALSLLLPAGFWLHYRLNRFEWILTDRRLVVIGGWLARRAHSVSLDEVNEISYRRSLLDRSLFSTGAIMVETDATAGATTLNFAADDDPFRHAIETQVELRRRRVNARAA